jgi:hypothetical protein
MKAQMETPISFTNLNAYQEWKISDDPVTRWSHHQKVLDLWNSSKLLKTEIWGWCDVCSTDSYFLLDDLYSDKNKDPWQPNWRERLVCTGCFLNSRMRASYSLLSPLFVKESDVWIAEQTTSFYRALSSRYENLIGSEYFGSKFQPGELLEGGMRNEDCTNTSFSDNSLDGVLSFDVMEHFPEFEVAINEAYRILRPNGVFFWSAPFNINEEKTSVRAKLSPDGTINHLMDPIMHGDPINPSEGILCFQIFGWDILDSMRNAGFSKVEVLLFWSKSRVVLGDPLPFFFARK